MIHVVDQCGLVPEQHVEECRSVHSAREWLYLTYLVTILSSAKQMSLC